MQIIFQDPYASLNPRLTIEQALIEPMLVHSIGDTYPIEGIELLIFLKKWVFHLLIFYAIHMNFPEGKGNEFAWLVLLLLSLSLSFAMSAFQPWMFPFRHRFSI